MRNTPRGQSPRRRHVARSQVFFGGPYPIAASANQRYLMQGGSPVLLMGDSPHGFINHLNSTDADSLCSNRASKGFNCLWCEVVETDYTGNGNTSWTTFDGIAPFTGTIVGDGSGPLASGHYYDITTPNSTYFARVDQYLAIAASYNITLILDPMETGPGGTGMPTWRNNGTSAMTTWGQFLGNRYKNSWNVIWMIGNDYQSAIDTLPNSTDQNLGKALLDGIIATDPNHLRSVEYCYYTSGSLDGATIRPDLTLAGAYHYGSAYYKVHDQYAHSSGVTLPVFLQEGFYEDAGYGGGPTTRRGLRAQAYYTICAGGLAGYVYGSIYTDPFQDAGGLSPWQTTYNTNGVVDLGIWKTFITSKAWYTLQPDWSHVIVTAGYDGDSSGAVSTTASNTYGNDAGSTGDDWCMCAADSLSENAALSLTYCPRASTITVDLSKFRDSITARWFDPTNASYTTVTGSPFTNSGTQTFKNGSASGASSVNNSLSTSDWVLVLEA